MLPNFLIIGAARSGTSTLYIQLQNHPDVFLPRNKRPEPHFFFKASEYAKGIDYYSQRHFSEWKGQQAVGEASTSYLFGVQTPGRVARALPNARLVVMLRNPIDRAYSNYQHTVASGLETLDFVQAVAREDERTAGLAGSPLDEIKPFSYLARGLYWTQIERWLAHFQRSQMHFILFDDFTADQTTAIGGVLEFLGLPRDRFEVDPRRIENKSAVERTEIAQATREAMRRYFKEDVDKLGAFLGRDLSGWLG